MDVLRRWVTNFAVGIRASCFCQAINKRGSEIKCRGVPLANK